MKILIVEDEPSLRELMCRELQRENHVVESASCYVEADRKLAGYSYDCILLDIMLPDGNGLRLLEELKRQERRENVIIISARDSIEDKVEGLELGADDYLPKPFHLMELSARIRSVARRHRAGERGFRIGNVYLDPDKQSVVVAGEPLNLLKKEFHILAYFMQRPNHLVDKTLLAEAAIRAVVVKVSSAKNTGGCAYGVDLPCTQMSNAKTVLSRTGIKVREYLQG